MEENIVFIDTEFRWEPMFCETYSALANSHGGILTFGYKVIEGCKKFQGLKNIDEIVDQIQNILNDAQKINRKFYLRKRIREAWINVNHSGSETRTETDHLSKQSLPKNGNWKSNL